MFAPYKQPNNSPKEQGELIPTIKMEVLKMIVNFCKTKAGKGFKIVVNGKWLYTSKQELFKVLKNEANGCIFREIIKSN